MYRVEEPATAGIKIRPTTKKKLEELKTHPRETYDQVISRLIDFYKADPRKEVKQ